MVFKATDDTKPEELFDEESKDKDEDNGEDMLTEDEEDE